jgi:hypothetical protein
MPTRLLAVRPGHRATVAIEDSVLEYNSVRNRYYNLHSGGSLRAARIADAGTTNDNI